MKNLILTLLTLSSASLFAEDPKKPFKLKDEGGGAFAAGVYLSYGGMMSQNLGEDAEYDGFNRIRSTQLYGSLARGLEIGVNADYMMKDYWGVGLGVQTLIGSEFQVSHEKSTNGYEETTTWQGRYTGISLDMVMRTCCEGDLQGVARFGPVFIPGSGFIERFRSTMNGVEQYSIEEDFRNRAGLGIRGTVGAEYQVADGVFINLGLTGQMFNGRTRSSEYTRYQDQGVDQLKDFSTAEKQTNYMQVIDRNSNAPGNPNYDQSKPRDAQEYRNSYERMGGLLGVRFTF